MSSMCKPQGIPQQHVKQTQTLLCKYSMKGTLYYVKVIALQVQLNYVGMK